MRVPTSFDTSLTLTGVFSTTSWMCERRKIQSIDTWRGHKGKSKTCGPEIPATLI